MPDLQELADRVERGWATDVEVSMALLEGCTVFFCLRSLDAAKALHDTVLPGWGRTVDATGPSSGILVEVHEPEPYNDGSGKVFGADCKNECAAWVAAILRAKAHQTPQTGERT